MNTNIVRSGVAALALGAVLVSATGLPAKADTTSTRNIIYGAAAAAAAFTLYNAEHKHALATTVQGYLPDGSTVYRDGHVVSRNGQSRYPGNYGETVACNNQYCTINGGNNYGYNNGGYYNGGYNNGGYNNGGYNNGGYNNGYNNGGYNGDNNGGYYNQNDGDGDESGNDTQSNHRGHHHHG